VVRFTVPHFDSTPNIPVSDEYRAAEGAQIRALLSALIRERRPDVLFIGRETYAWHVPDLARRNDLPCVLRFPGVTSYGVLSGTYPKELAHHLLEQYRKTDLRISPARHLAERLSARGLDPITVIPTAVDLDDFSPRPKPTDLLERLGITPGDVVVAHVANMKDIKRSPDVVASASQALRRDRRLVYVMVGDGPLRPRLEGMCRTAGIGERFRFPGWVDYRSIPDYMSLADIVLVASEYEGLARVYIEAQASGRVLIASDIALLGRSSKTGDGPVVRLGRPITWRPGWLQAAGDPDLRVGQQARVRRPRTGSRRRRPPTAALTGVAEAHRPPIAR
jgi:glycosyltransferase involved in cell wall biosynthesis